MNPRSKYPIHQSPFFKLTTKRRLYELLGVGSGELKKFASDINYRVWEEDGREIQAPKKKLKALHARIKDLLSRIETPAWLMSGQRGKSYLTNAEAHHASDYLLNVDITGFYKNTSRERVYQCFIHMFKMSHDLT